ncbi:hypothetical protein D5S17_09120 [Pseudonocardiaceae bacterium YIM PH 21723]|nr:hypothetical protein D5S17_09120 [Pseudonocardiaceae bacterium YIM PH 21723]
MSAFYLTVHVLLVILAVGPIAVAGSMFPRAIRKLAAAPEDPTAIATARVLLRICQVYAGVAVFVPVFGILTAFQMHVLTHPWVLVSLGLTTVAALLFGLLVLPAQQAAVAAPGQAVAGRLDMWTGIFNLLWLVVTVLMILRPGSTTGV